MNTLITIVGSGLFMHGDKLLMGVGKLLMHVLTIW